ncbi:MAG: DUF1330 domain-containing protein [Alphaproteobacteria bacterium]|nr:DUF1330 domain-containing protein [Alphaproteobacteria bacterium]
MPKGYLIAQTVVTDPEAWGRYVEKTKPALAKFGGIPIARGGRCEIPEGNGFSRNVIIEFPSYEAALGYARSPEYADAKALRQDAGIMNMTIVEGI